jgi:hypothetical protein
MKMDRLVKLEKALEGRLDRLTRRKGAPEEPSEWVPPLLEEIEQRIVPSGGRGRVFPYEVIRVELRVEAATIEAARAVFGAGAFEARVRERLRQVRCETPEGLSVAVRVRARAGEDEAPYAIAFRRPSATRRTEAKAAAERAAAGVPAVRIVVLAGHARRRIHELRLERINLGRMDSVEGRGAEKLRRNHVAFQDGEDPIDSTVSRAHAHIEWFAGDGFRVFDDGSAHGTRVTREGRSIAVARGAVRGVRLRHGDEIELGLAKVTFMAE